MRLPRTIPSLDDEQQYGVKRLAASVADQALEQYTAYLGPRPERGRYIDEKNWKIVKVHDGLRIYRSTKPSLSPIYSGLGHRIDPNTDYWTPSTMLLGIGTISGTLQDAMYGCIASTELDMAIRSQYLRDELCEHRAILQLQRPDQHHPFRSLGVKQVVRTAGLTPFVRPRDIVFLEATEMREVQLRNRTRRLGIAVSHSVKVANAPQDATSGTIRGHISLVLIFRQRSVHHVEVFSILSSAPGENAGLRLATSAGVAAITALSRVVECALSKKLAWALATQVAAESNTKTGNPSASQDVDTCRNCGREPFAFRSFIECEMCHSQHCHKCSATREVVFAQSKFKLSTLAIEVCKACLRHIQQLDPPPPSSRVQNPRVVASLRASERSRNLERSASIPVSQMRPTSESRRRPHLRKTSSVPLERSTRTQSLYRTRSREMVLYNTNSRNGSADVDEEVCTDRMQPSAQHGQSTLEDLLSQLVSTATETSQVANSISRSMIEASLGMHASE